MPDEGERITCPDCGKEITSKDELEKGEHVHELEFVTDEDEPSRPPDVYGRTSKDLYLCGGCGRPLGVSRGD
jgi:DNA-directed RNA polymerase subunit RPC12/RpoP